MSGLALPPNGTRPSEDASTELNEADTFLQSDEFLKMIGAHSFAELNESFADFNPDAPFQIIPDSANSNQISPFGSSIPAIDTQVQMPTPPVMEPNFFGGPRFHPEVGWYFTAQPSSGLSTPLPQFPIVQDRFTPASSLPSSLLPSAMPSGATTPNPFMLPPKRAKNPKRKFGPAAFLEEQAKKRAVAQQEAAILPPPSFDFTAKKKEVSHPLHNRKQPLVIQNCVCTDKEALKIKRPKNAFIIYRSTVSKQIIKQLGRNDNQTVSQVAGQWWRQIKDTSEGKKFFRLAEEEAARHQQMYPDYKYKPGQSARNKFGSSHCTCGAYEANLKAMRESEGINDLNSEDDFGDDSSFVPPASSRPVVREAAQAPIPDLASLGLPANQQAGAQAHIDALKRKREAADAMDVHAQEPIAKRRSLRSSTKDVDYSEPRENDIFRPVTPDNGRKGRPSQAGFLNSSPTMSHAGIRVDSPARNTRSASLSRARSESPSQIIPQTVYPFDFGDDELNNFNPQTDADWEDIFANSGIAGFVQGNEVDAAGEIDVDDQSGLEAELEAELQNQAEAEAEESDCITVAQHRSSRGKSGDSQTSPPSPTMTTRNKKSSTSAEVSNLKTSGKPRRSGRKISNKSVR